MQSIENEATIQELRNGNIDVYEEVYCNFYKPLYGMAFRYLRDEDLAEDAVQDIFLKLWDNRINLDINKSLHGFLFSALKNHVLNLIKSNDRRVKRQCEYIYNTVSEVENPEFIVIEEDYNRLLKKGLRKLPEKKRMVFNLKRLNGFSNEMIASHLNISNNTVKSHLYQVRKFILSYIIINSHQLRSVNKSSSKVSAFVHKNINLHYS